MDRLDPSSSLLLLVDVQDRLAAAMPQGALEAVIANGRVLLEAARLLGVPVLATEQYPKGLGSTVGPLKEMLVAAGVQPIEKLIFDACGEPRVVHALAARSPRSVILAGLEAHVCVFQTARELVRRGMSVCVVADAVASRREENRALGLALAERAGALIAPAETVVFDWLQRAGTEEFRALSKLLR
jgi:nicotinamidase-related amidase